MTREIDDDLPRLRAAGSPEARELLRSAEADAPSASARQAGMAHVLSVQRATQSRPWLLIAAAVVAGLGIGYVSFFRPPPAVTPLAREPQLSASSSALALGPERGPSPAAASASAARAPDDDQFAPCSPAARSAGDAPMIDDFEDGDGRILRIDRRAGSWSTFNDTTGVQRPTMGGVMHAERIAGGRGASRFALHTSGSKFTKWGASLAVELSPRRCYDASAYSGIMFWARGHGKINAVVRMTQVVSEEFGGSCVHDCYDGHRSVISLASDWQLYHVRWEDLSQAGFGASLTFDPRSLFSIEFQVLTADTPFDFWIDDLSFIER